MSQLELRPRLAAAAQLEPPAPSRTALADPDVERARRLARLLDRYFLDPILGLIAPGAGDLLGSLLGLYIVGVALRRRMSPVIVARMLLNLGLDALLGVVPLLGDLVDFGWRANTRNADLLVSRDARGGRATARDWLILAGTALGFIAVIALAVYAILALVDALG